MDGDRGPMTLSMSGFELRTRSSSWIFHWAAARGAPFGGRVNAPISGCGLAVSPAKPSVFDAGNRGPRRDATLHVLSDPAAVRRFVEDVVQRQQTQ